MISVGGDDIEINSVSPHCLHSVHDRSRRIHNFYPQKLKKSLIIFAFKKNYRVLKGL